MATKSEIFAQYKKEYRKASRKRKGAILDVVCEVTGMLRKSAIRKFRRLQMKGGTCQEGRGRPERYTPDVIAALKYVWDAASEPCGEILHPMMAEYVDIFRRDKMWAYDDGATAKLLAMSERTMKRRVGAFLRVRRKKGGMTGTSPSLLKHIIPIFKGPWHDLPPGSGQLDTVAHCGDSLAGDFIWTVNYTDTATYWTALRAQWNKGQVATVASMEAITRAVPFPVTGMHPDSGGEFINWVAKGWCDERGIDLSRSEPNRKNDNMYVEERNGHIVRKHLGYARLDCPDLVALINEMYDVLGRYLNHFRAVRRMASKVRVGARYVRTYEKHAQMPYQRTLAHSGVSDEVKARLRAEHETLNPLLLKQDIDTLKEKIYKMLKATRHRDLPQ
ncbi:hypothetical protein HY091_01380 [Candidatus Kaiserbacteria bacterium]|nr:hypothetical protein [Candidatus Kaiserbacteria bacterium]